MRIRVYNQGSYFACLLLGIFTFLCSCSKNKAERPAGQPPVASVSSAGCTYATRNDEANLLETVLQVLREDPASINTVRVSSNGQEVSLLTAAVMFGEDTTIKSLLDQGADIKAADREGDGIINTIIDNPRWNDQQKAGLIQWFFEKAVAVDDINTNRVQHRKNSLSGQTLCTPWLRALEMGCRQTALAIINKMSFEQADRDGLFHAVLGKASKDIVQDLLGKRVAPQPHDEVAKQVFNKHGIHEETLIGKTLDYCARYFNGRDCYIEGKHFWRYSWVNNNDSETAISIIKKFMPYQDPSMAYEVTAAEANEALGYLRTLEARHLPTIGEINAEWQHIKAALVDIGVPAELLHD
jgi:hypothetical protein